MHKRLEPKLFSVLREGYTKEQFMSDLVAGVIVGVVALPLAIAFAIASGVKPEQGLYTAIIAGLIVSEKTMFAGISTRPWSEPEFLFDKKQKNRTADRLVKK